MSDQKKKSFREAAEGPQQSAFRELLAFAFQNKKWWLTPIAILLLLASALIILGGSGVAPFIYSIF